MLGKLLKYEFKATSRTFLPMYALLIVMSFINKFFYSNNFEYFKIPKIISMTVFIVVIAGISVMTLIITIQRFNKSLLTDEGYLSFTLPVKAHLHIDAKMIASFVWSLLSVLVSLIAIFVMIANHNVFAELGQLWKELSDAIAKVGPGAYVLLLEAILLLIITTLGSIVEIYAAITIGNLSSKHKLLAGVGAFIGFGIVQQIVVSIFITALGPNVEEYFESISRSGVQTLMNVSELVMLVLILYTLVFGLAFYFLTNWMLTKKLNLE